MGLEKQFLKIIENSISCTGSSVREIEAAEKEWKIELPAIYKEFLTILGEQANHLFCGCNVELDGWEYINKRGRESYEAALKKQCPETTFFFMEHHGYSYYYFDLREGENPEIQLLVVGDTITHEAIGKLDQVLERKIDLLIKAKKR